MINLLILYNDFHNRNHNDLVINPFQPSVAFLVETRHLICNTNQVTGFCMKCNTGLKWVNICTAQKMKFFVNSFIPNAPFLYPLKTVTFSDVFRG